MTMKQTPVYNSANLAMFMVNVSHPLIRSMSTYWPEVSVNDLKAWFRSRKYVVETLKLLPEMGFDHGVGHPHLLLCNAKAPNC